MSGRKPVLNCGVIIIPLDMPVRDLGFIVTPNAYRMQAHQGDFSRLVNYHLYRDIVIIGDDKDRETLDRMRKDGVNLPDFHFFEREAAREAGDYVKEFANGFSLGKR